VKCSICKEKISTDISGKWDGGHNAQPITDGRCCDVCNDTIVVPARVMQFYPAIDFDKMVEWLLSQD